MKSYFNLFSRKRMLRKISCLIIIALLLNTIPLNIMLPFPSPVGLKTAEASIADRDGLGMEDFWNYVGDDLGAGWSYSINTFTGNLTVQKDLLSIPGRGVNLSDGIVYNSQSSSAGILGTGWQLNNQLYLFECSDGAIFKDEDATNHTFTKNADGTYKAPDGVHLKLTKENSTTFALKDKAQSVYRFKNGPLISVTDEKGNVTEFSYTDNRLVSMTDPAKRKLNYAYESGLLKTITDPAGRVTTFSYTDGKLTSVFDPKGNTTSFGYNESGRLATVTDANNHTTTFGYGSDGWVTQVKDGRSSQSKEYVTTISYDTGLKETRVTDPANKTFIYTHNAFGNLIRLQDSAGVESSYNWDKNNLIKETDSSGSTTTTYDSNGNVTSEQDTISSGVNATTNITYDNLDNPTSVTDPNGNQTTARYSEKSNLLSVGNPSRKEADANTYDSYGNLTSSSDPGAPTLNYLQNGSFEWADAYGKPQLWNLGGTPSAVSVVDTSTARYGNAALKISSSTPISTYLYSRKTTVSQGQKLTFSVAAKMENIAGEGGVDIGIEYYSASWGYVKSDYSNIHEGSGNTSLVVTSEVPSGAAYAIAVLELTNASGTVWFDGAHLESPINAQEGHILSKFDYVENSGFEASVVAGDGRVDLSWSASSESGSTYNIYRATTSGGPYTKVNASAITGTSFTDTAVVNCTTYYYVVRTVDSSGNESANSSQVSARPLYQETNAKIAYSGTWTSTSYASASGGAIKVSSDVAGQIATFTFTGTSITYIASKNWNYGAAKIYIDGVWQQDVDLYAPSMQYQQAVFTKTGLSADTHTIKIESRKGIVGTSSYNANIDAFDITPCADTVAPPAPSGVAASIGDAVADTYWNARGTSGAATIVTESPWEGQKCAKVNLTTSGSAWMESTFIPVRPNEPLTLSGFIKTNNVVGTGAQLQVHYYNSDFRFVGSQETTTQAGTKDFTCYAFAATLTTETAYAVVAGKVASSTGIAYFDNIKLTPRVTTQYEYDANGNYVTGVTDPLGNKLRFSYDASGNCTSTVDALGNTYDELNNLTSVTDAMGNVSRYEYDPVALQVSYRDARSDSAEDNTYKTAYFFNELNDIIKTVDPLGRETTNTYDDAGKLTATSFSNGRSINYVYDDGNRLKEKSYSHETTKFTYAYDPSGNLKQVSDDSSRLYQFTYDKANRLTSLTDLFDYKQDYTIDKAGNITKIADSLSNQVSYTYGSANQLLSLTDTAGKQTTFSYDEAGRLFQTIKGNGIKTVTLFDDAGRLSQISDVGYLDGSPTKASLLNYTYDANSNIIKTQSENGIESFTYDALNRLASWTDDSTTTVYEYDKVGNLTRKGDKTFTYNAANEITNEGFTYDLAGNLTRDSRFNYRYNSENQLVEVTSIENSSTVATYEYDFRGLRISKTTANGTVRYHWDSSDCLLRESDTSGNTIAQYIYDDKDRLIAVEKGGKVYYTHTNHRGDVISITDKDKNIVATYNYGPWGELPSQTGTFDIPIRYAGYYFDSETGMYYLKARYYSPEIGRFLTKDTVKGVNGDPQTLNLYAYCGGNPIINIDSDGHTPVLAAIIIGAAIGGTFANYQYMYGAATKKTEYSGSAHLINVGVGAATGGLGSGTTGVIKASGASPRVVGTMACHTCVKFEIVNQSVSHATSSKSSKSSKPTKSSKSSKSSKPTKSSKSSTKRR